MDETLSPADLDLLGDLRTRLSAMDDVPADDLAAPDAPERSRVEDQLRRLYDGDYIDGFVPDDGDFPLMIEAVTGKGERALGG